MYNEATFRLIGRIAKINRAGKTLRVTVASNYSVKLDNGDYDDRVRFNTVTVFGRQAEWVETKRQVGDFVLVEGNLEDRKYEKDGETVYTTDRLTNTFELLSGAPAKKEEPAKKAAGKGRKAAQPEGDNIPF
ncbi:single-stranded DNA-binding protein [Labrys sp. 22185]|uniref:single-stranded DNA-binding protein n=1 Tax=Labrys sp. 22185 TaxID=3453888 RepID=UPI003F866628